MKEQLVTAKSGFFLTTLVHLLECSFAVVIIFVKAKSLANMQPKNLLLTLSLRQSQDSLMVSLRMASMDIRHHQLIDHLSNLLRIARKFENSEIFDNRGYYQDIPARYLKISFVAQQRSNNRNKILYFLIILSYKIK